MFSRYTTKQTTEAGQKVIRFMNILETYEQKLNSKDKNEKSSQLFPLLFKGVANLVIDHWKVRSHQLFKPFDILEKCDNLQWRKMGDSNPRYLAVHIVSNDARSTTLPTFHDLSSNHRETNIFFKYIIILFLVFAEALRPPPDHTFSHCFF